MSRLGVETTKMAKRCTTDLRLYEDGKVYYLLLTFAQKQWPLLNLFDDRALDVRGNIFLSTRVAQKHGHYVRNGSRYGSLHNNATTADRFVLLKYEGERWPAEVHYIFRIQCYDIEPALCVIARRYRKDEYLPRLPWDLR